MRQDMPGDRLEQAGAVLQFGKLLVVAVQGDLHALAFAAFE